MIRHVQLPPARFTLGYYAADPIFREAVADLRERASRIAPLLRGRTVWMINSTSQGGGVAEMMPGIMSMLNDVGLTMRWGVIHTGDQEFFRLTKQIHNMIHDNPATGVELGPAEAQLYEAVNRENAISLRKELQPGDIIVVHDPQPLPLGDLLVRTNEVTAVWRCHIGCERTTAVTEAAWRFLAPWLTEYRQAIFSLPEYVPPFLADRSVVINPGIDPLSHKNQDLTVTQVVGILCDSGLQRAYEPTPTHRFRHQAMRIVSDGSSVVPGELGLLFRPIILQVSRWDRLKGWLSLLEGFIRLKHNTRAYQFDKKMLRHHRWLDLSRLVLAGPEPGSVADDPEGTAALEEIRERYLALEPETRHNVIVLLLPMASRKDNALIVNALQRCATVVVQNSLREGFGLSATEAMWKRKPVLGADATGIRAQIRDGIDGLLVKNPEDPDEIAEKLQELLFDPYRCGEMGRSAQRRVYDHFLVFRQVASFLELFERIA